MSKRNRVVIGAEETTRVRYAQDKPSVSSRRKAGPRASSAAPSSGRTSPSSQRPKSAGLRVANQKRDERERRRRQIARRRAFATVGVVMLVIGMGWGIRALWEAPIFTIKTVNVTGTSHLQRADVIALAAIATDTTLLRMPEAQIRSRIGSSPWVASVSLLRSFPSTLDIRIAERVPAAIVDAQSAGQWLVTADGHWIVARTKETTVGVLPVRDVPNLHPVAGQSVSSPELSNALGVIAGVSPELRAQTKFVSAATVEKTMLVLKNDVQVFFGPAEDVAKKDLIARTILVKEKNIVYINVRVTDRPTWRGLTASN